VYTTTTAVHFHVPRSNPQDSRSQIQVPFFRMPRRMPHDAPPPHPQMPTPHTVCQARARHVDDVAPTLTWALTPHAVTSVGLTYLHKPILDGKRLSHDPLWVETWSHHLSNTSACSTTYYQERQLDHRRLYSMACHKRHKLARLLLGCIEVQQTILQRLKTHHHNTLRHMLLGLCYWTLDTQIKTRHDVMYCSTVTKSHK